jgi:hypothetical protein
MFGPPLYFLQQNDKDVIHLSIKLIANMFLHAIVFHQSPHCHPMVVEVPTIWGNY